MRSITTEKFIDTCGEAQTTHSHRGTRKAGDAPIQPESEERQAQEGLEETELADAAVPPRSRHHCGLDRRGRQGLEDRPWRKAASAGPSLALDEKGSPSLWRQGSRLGHPRAPCACAFPERPGPRPVCGCLRPHAARRPCGFTPDIVTAASCLPACPPPPQTQAVALHVVGQWRI